MYFTVAFAGRISFVMPVVDFADKAKTQPCVQSILA